MSDGFSLDDALDKAKGAGQEFKSVLGIQREVFSCPECGEPCTESNTYNANTAAFDGGSCPSWYCEECESHYVREADTEAFGMDLYDR